MHSEMTERPTVTVGRQGADILGADNRALQAAVDYVAGLGGGVVEVGAGEYLMRDALHLRSGVTVRGRKGTTVLHKADAAASPLALDGDFGEQQITVKDPAGVAVGCGVAVWDDHAGGFHTTVARVTGRRGHTFAIDAPLMADCMVAAHARAATYHTDRSGSRVSPTNRPRTGATARPRPPSAWASARRTSPAGSRVSSMSRPSPPLNDLRAAVWSLA
jgi:polygalacturonase